MTLLAMLIFVAVFLTITMFATRRVMLGFPSAMFWAIAGAQAYTLSVIPWGDIYYYTFFASLGMTIFCVLAMYGLRASDLSGPDADEGTYFDEEKEPDLRGNIDKGDTGEDDNPSRRSKAVRGRARRRRSE